MYHVIHVILYYLDISVFYRLVTGDFYSDDVTRAMPYKNPLVKVVITGRTILKALEHSAAGYDYKNCNRPEENIFGNVMHMSGKEYKP